MTISKAILLEPMPGVCAEGKILFLRFLQENGDRGLRATIRKLAVAYRVPLKAVTQAAVEIEGAGFWARVPVPSDRGRPSFEYRVVPAVWDRLMSQAGKRDTAAGLQPYIDRLNQCPGAGWVEEDVNDGVDEVDRAPRPKPPNRAGEGNRLNNPNRLLLMVLLALADDLGVVRGNGVADLAALTGLTTSRVQTQIEKLLKLQFLRAVVPGVSGRRLFGKVPGAYFLNLHHPSFGRKDEIGGAIFLLEAVHPCMREGPALFRAARDRGGAPFMVRRCPWSDFSTYPLLGSESVIRELASILDAPHSGGLPEYLQFMIEAYASRLLSQRWDQFGAGPGDTSPMVYGDATLLGEIARCLMPKRESKKAAGEIPTEYQQLGSLILDISARLAEMIKYHLVRARLPSVFGRLASTYQEMNFLLMPATEALGERYFSIILMPKMPGAMIGPSYVGKIEYGRRWNHVFDDGSVHAEAYAESELSRYGLITLIKSS